MTIRAILLSFLAPLLACAQLQVFVLGSTGPEQPAPGLLDMGTVQVSELLEQRMRIRNIGQTSITLQSLVLAGSGFKAVNYPSLPYIVAPGTNVDFRVQFAPLNFGSYSASLTINSISILLRATASAGAVLSVNGTAMSSGATVDFGLVERGSSSSRRFVLKNTTNTLVTVNAASVSGAGFKPGGGFVTPIEIAGNGEVGFDIIFSPSSSGIAQGTLQLDARTFRLTGSASEPPFPRPAVVLESNALTSAKQVKAKVSLASVSRAVGDGKLTIEFRPSTGVTDNDAGLQFVSNSSRTLSFHVAEGATEATFGDVTETILQTGTSAGTMVVTAEIGGFREQVTATIAPNAVQIDTAKAVRNGSLLEVQIVGYDNTRSMGKTTFTFFNTAGQPIAPGAIQADSAEAVTRFFSTSKVGGLFSLTAAFPVAGDISQIAGVEVQLQNSAGTASTQRLRF